MQSRRRCVLFLICYRMYYYLFCDKTRRPTARPDADRTDTAPGAARGGGPTPYIYAGEGRDRTLHDGTFRSEYTHRTEVKSKSERNYTRRRR